MIVLDRVDAAVLAAIAVFWIAMAAWATIAGIRRSSASRAVGDETSRLAALIATAPAMPLIVAGDGGVEEGARLGRWLGLAEPPTTLADLADEGFGLPEKDVEALSRDVAATRRSARGFTRAITMAGSGRVLLVKGQPDTVTGRVILWFIDMTDSEREIERLGVEVLRLRGMIEALSTLIEAAPFPMWHRGPDLRLNLVNGAYVRAVEGQSAQQVVKSGLELIEAGAQGRAFQVPTLGREPGSVSIRTAPAIIAGERRTIRVVDVPLGEAGMAGYAIDVEELEEARADLRRFVVAQRDMLDRLSAAVAQFGGDHGLVFYNRHFIRLFPLEPEWLAEGPTFDRILERMREEQRVPEARDFPGWKAERRAWFNSAAPMEESWLLPGGTHLRVVAQPLPDGGLLLIMEDRTEHLQLARARDTLLRVRTATFDNLFEAIGVFAADGRLQLFNSRFRDVWKLSEEHLSNHPRVDTLVQAIAPQLADPSRAGLVRELVRVATVERQQRVGRIAMMDGRHFEFAAVPLPDGNALFTLLDVTASREIEHALRERNDALEATDRMKSAFVANMSYELRVPLTTIAGFAEMLADGYAGDLSDTAKQYVDAIVRGVGRLSQLMGDVLDLTQSEVGSLPLSRASVDLGQLARQSLDAAEDAARNGNIGLRRFIGEGKYCVIGDDVRLRQALDHLLRNAIDYTQDGGEVRLSVSASGEQAVVMVSDNGPGLSPDQHRSIFEPRQIGGSEDGRGIGLPLVKQLVEAHEGSLTLESEPGVGTRAIIRLPLTDTPARVSLGA